MASPSSSPSSPSSPTSLDYTTFARFPENERRHWIERALCAAGWDAVDAPDEIPGRHAGAIVEFQLAHDLHPDGIVGPKTFAALLPYSEAQQHTEAGLRDRAVHAALRCLGAKEAPPGSNRGGNVEPIVRDYLHANKLRGGVPWCAVAVCHWIARAYEPEASHPNPDRTPLREWIGAVRGKNRLSLERWASDNRLLLPVIGADAANLRGAFFIMGRAGSGSDAADAAVGNTRSPVEHHVPGHTGIITNVIDAENGRVAPATIIESVDGNVSNAVLVKRRPASALIAYVPWWRAPPPLQ